MRLKPSIKKSSIAMVVVLVVKEVMIYFSRLLYLQTQRRLLTHFYLMTSHYDIVFFDFFCVDTSYHITSPGLDHDACNNPFSYKAVLIITKVEILRVNARKKGI